MRIATYNANSIRSRLDAMLEWLAEHQPDVLCVQETKLQDSEFPADPIRDAGYHVVYAGQKSYNGVAILSREEPTDVMTGFDDDGPADTSRLIRATIGPVTIVNTYVPQGRDIEHEMYAYKVEWLGRFRRYVDRHFTAKSNLVWTGDLNVAHQPMDVYNPEKRAKHVCYHQDAREALAHAFDWGFEDVYRRFNPKGGEYTFYDYRTIDSVGKGWGWRIDYIMASPPVAKKATAAFIDLKPRRQPKASDHTYLVADFDL